MALGPQFDNTYWHDEEGRVQSSITDRRHVTEPSYEYTWKGEDPSHDVHPSVINHDYLKPSTHTDLSDTGLRQEMRATNNPTIHDSDRYGLQGMLFSPHVGTGQKDDPLVSPGRRQAAAITALGLDKPSRTRKRGHADLLTDTLVNTEFSTSEIESLDPVNARVVAANRSFDGSWNDRGRVLTMARHTKSWTERTEPTIVESTLPSDTPIFNEKFGAQFQRKIEAPELFEEDVTRSAGDSLKWRDPKTGDVLTTREELSDASREFGPKVLVRHSGFDIDPDHYTFNSSGHFHEYGTREEDKETPVDWGNERNWRVKPGESPEPEMSHLVRSGFVPNLFFGKGVAPDNKKVHSEPHFRAERDYMTERGTYPAVDVHTRFEPGGVETTTIPGKTITRRSSSLSGETMVHELGHATDHNDGDAVGRILYTSRFRRDPMSEGRAEGTADRYSSGGRLEEAMSDVDLTSRDITTKGGYATEPEWGNGVWQNKTQKALFAGTRAHARMQGLQSQHTSRTAVRNDLIKSMGLSSVNNLSDSDIDTMTLGHMWEHYPHVREHIEKSGYGKVAQKAHGRYMEASGKRPHEEGDAQTAYLNAMEDKSIHFSDRPRSQPKQKETLF